jgi:transaldolase
MPEETLIAFADHGGLGPIMAADSIDSDKALDQFAKAGIDIDTLGAQLQEQGAESFVKSWNDLTECIASKSKALRAA